DYTLTYSQNWSNAAKRGLPVPQADVTKIFFYVKTLSSDVNAWLKLTDASASQIQWLDTVNGKIRVFFPVNTEGHTGDRQPFECRAQLTDSSLINIESGFINVLESTVDQG